jgi:tRNA threonylcarbamoyladenosine biosynthesis protein TsaB
MIPYTDTSPSLAPARIVAIETSSRIGSVAVALGPQLLTRRRFSHSLRHAVELMPAIRDLTRDQSWKPADIEHVYVSAGPGSFTGVRIAITVARALHQAIGCRLIAVPTVDVLALNAPAQTENLVVLLDAKRGQIYSARYRRILPGEDFSPTAAHPPVRIGGWVRTAGPLLTDPEQFIRETPRPLAMIGEGMDYHRAAIRNAAGDSTAVAELEQSLWPPRVENVHALGWTLAQAGKFISREDLLPIYLRKPEAEEVWEKKRGGGGYPAATESF